MTLSALILMSMVAGMNPLPDQFDFRFKEGVARQPLLKLFGPSVRHFAETDAQGLKIVLPSARSAQSWLGVETIFRIRGDFEATLTYELLSIDNPPPTSGTGVSIWLLLAGEIPQEFMLTRLRKGDIGVQGFRDTFGANVSKSGSGKVNSYTKAIGAESGQGGLRLIREGGTLYFFASDGAGAEFQHFHSTVIGNDEIKALRAQCRRGGGEGSIEARLLELSVHAEELLKPVGTEMRQSGAWTKWFWVSIGICCLTGIVVVFHWFVKRRAA